MKNNDREAPLCFKRGAACVKQNFVSAMTRSDLGDRTRPGQTHDDLNQPMTETVHVNVYPPGTDLKVVEAVVP